MIDTHAHLDMKDFENDLLPLLGRAREAGISTVITVGIDVGSSKKALELARQHREIFSTAGVHPHDSATFTTSVLKIFDRLFENPKVVAVGEIGLDYYRNLAPAEIQKKTFESQARYALERGLPLVIHCRDAYEDMKQFIEKLNITNAVMHCYSGDLEFAKFLVERGIMASFTAAVTYPRKRGAVERLVRILEVFSLERIMVETDCPYLPPLSRRGERNEPAYVVESAARIAELLGTSYEEVEKKTTANAERFFKLKERRALLEQIAL